MNGTVYKFPIGCIGVPVDVEMPEKSRWLTMQMQHGVPTLWALVDLFTPRVMKRVILIGTGHSYDRLGDYIGTAQTDSGLVWHAFEVAS